MLLIDASCETTALDSFGYTWDTSDNCVVTKILALGAKMLHYPLTMYREENLFFFLSEFIETGKGMNIKFKVCTENYELCRKPERLCKRNFESLFLKYQGGIAIPGGEIRKKEFLSNAYQFSIDNSSQALYRSLGFCESNRKWVGAQHWRSVSEDEMDYQMHLGTKLDFIMFSTPSN